MMDHKKAKVSRWRSRLATEIALSRVCNSRLKPLAWLVIGLLLYERKQAGPSEQGLTFALNCSARRARFALWILNRCSGRFAELTAGVIIFFGVRASIKADSQAESDLTI